MVLASGARVASGEVFNIAHPEPATWEELGGAAARILGRKVVRVRVPPWAAFLACAGSGGIGRLSGRPTALNLSKYRDMLPDAWEADVAKARRELGFEARVPLEEGLQGDPRLVRPERAALKLLRSVPLFLAAPHL